MNKHVCPFIVSRKGLSLSLCPESWDNLKVPCEPCVEKSLRIDGWNQRNPLNTANGSVGIEYNPILSQLL